MRALRGAVIIIVVAVFCFAAMAAVRPELFDQLPWQHSEETPKLPAHSTFQIRFFDVGEADAALVECDGKYMMIDGGDPEDSSLLYAYLKEQDIRKLECVICSHAHADHVGGLSGALQIASVNKAYAPVPSADIWAFQSFVKYLKEQDKKITVPSPGGSFSLGSATVTFLGPVDMSLAEENENNSSLIVRIEYGAASFLFTGDAEFPEEQSVAAACGSQLRSTVLKVAHHGSSTSSTSEFLEQVRPKYCVISVGEDNDYDHPHDTTLERLTDYTNRIYRTDQSGDIVCTSDGVKVTFEGDK